MRRKGVVDVTLGEGRSSVRIDCDRCSARGEACSGCVVAALLGLPDAHVVAASLLTRPAARPADVVGVAGAASEPDPRLGAGLGAGLGSGLGEAERRALRVLAEAGMAPRVLGVREHTWHPYGDLCVPAASA